MNINISQKPMLQGSFNIKNKDTENSKNILKSQNKNNYDDRIKGLEAEIESIQTNEKDDAETKKQKIKALQDEIKEIRKLQQKEELEKLKSEDKNKDEKPYMENTDGDKLTLSEQMKDMIKADREIKNQEEKSLIKKELEAKETTIEIEIENDRTRNKSESNKAIAQASVDDELAYGLPKGVSQRELDKMDYNGFDTKHKDKDLEKIKDAIDNLEENEIEQLSKEDEKDKKEEVAPKIDDKELTEDEKNKLI